jgi:alpha-glucosidase
MKPLFLYDQTDEKTYNINDQFMVGDNIMLCPIVDQGKTSRIVYLPKGKWVNYFTNKVYNGGKNYMFEVPLDETLMFVKYNSIIPTFTRFNRVKEDYNRIIFKGYGKKATYKNYKDDYSTLNYKNGKFNVTTVKMNDKKVEISIQNNGIKPYESIDFIDILHNLKLM